ncbi:MAG: sulfur carrier protein ThiS [Deltaproteobacteria bacterium]|nr:sulfur carrier protein ThiS [Deltaproteobacteria bacterium]
MFFSEGQGARGKGQVKIMLNGKTKDVSEDTTVLGLLNELDIKLQGIAVELNFGIVSRSKYGETILENGDKVEIVRMVGGG